MPMLMRLTALAKRRIAATTASGATAQESPRRKPPTASHTVPIGPATRSGMGVFTASATR